MGRISVSDLAYSQTGGRFGAPPVGMENPYGSGRQNARVYSISTQYTRMFSPIALNELTLGVQRSRNSNGTLADPVNWANELGLPNPFGALGWPTMYTDLFAWDADNRKDDNLTGYVVEENITWVKGKHSFKAGGKFRYEQNNVRELQQAQGSHGFDARWTALVRSGWRTTWCRSRETDWLRWPWDFRRSSPIRTIADTSTSARTNWACSFRTHGR